MKNKELSVFDLKVEELTLLKTYTAAMLIQEVLMRYSQSERFGVLMVVYNKITSKHEQFEHQIKEFLTKKRKKVSRKTIIHTFASKMADEVWTEVINSRKKDEEIVINGIIKFLIFANKDELYKLYKIDSLEVFPKLELPKNDKGEDRINFDTINLARTFMDKINEKLEEIKRVIEG